MKEFCQALYYALKLLKVTLLHVLHTLIPTCQLIMSIS